MGHYAFLKFGNYTVREMKNVLDSRVTTFFYPGDKKITTTLEEDDYYQITYEYSAPIKSVIKRLEIMGFTLKGAEKEFEKGIRLALEQIPLSRKERYQIKRFTFARWIECMGWIIKHGLTHWNYEKLIPSMKYRKRDLPLIQFILDRYSFTKDDDDEHYSVRSTYYYGFSCYGVPYWDRQNGLVFSDIRYVFRAILECCDISETVNLDYGGLISWGTYEEDEELCEEVEKIVILVEGSTDKEILENTLQILYPDCVRYFSFMDFSGPNIDGGASGLVRNLKAFMSAGINNRIIAIFDNDTPAKDALKALKDIKVPDNIKIVTLPDLGFAKKYPTIGPQGTVNVDVNGLAGGIELYLGSDIICDSNGAFVPVQWLGYNQSLRQYNGEILDKKLIQDKYQKVLKLAKNDSAVFQQHDWQPMELVFDAIFQAFNN